MTGTEARQGLRKSGLELGAAAVEMLILSIQGIDAGAERQGEWGGSYC